MLVTTYSSNAFMDTIIELLVGYMGSNTEWKVFCVCGENQVESEEVRNIGEMGVQKYILAPTPLPPPPQPPTPNP